MSVRLIECKRILKDTGSLFYHCDNSMSHYIKVLLDMIFGHDNFRNEIIWHYPGGMKNLKKSFAHQNDSIIYYSKTQETYFYPQRGALTYNISQWKRWGKNSEDGKTIQF